MSEQINDPILTLITAMEAAGMPPEMIDQVVTINESAAEHALESIPESMLLDAADPKAAFKDKPEKPAVLMRRGEEAEFRQAIVLPSDAEYVLNGETRKMRRLNLNDMMRLGAKAAPVFKYLGYNTPEMLVDEFTGRYRVMETLLELFDRAFSDYDLELNRPTGLCYAVVEEICLLLDIKDQPGGVSKEDYLLSCDPMEVYEAVGRLVKYNQAFFIRAWENSGAIKDLGSLITGAISSYTKQMKLNLSLLNDAMKLNDSALSEKPSDLDGGQESSGLTT